MLSNESLFYFTGSPKTNLDHIGLSLARHPLGSTNAI